MNIKPKNALVKFRNLHCHELSYDDPEIIYLLLEKLAKKNKEMEENEKQK